MRSLLETFGGAPRGGADDADAAAKVAELQAASVPPGGMPFAARLVEWPTRSTPPPRTEREGNWVYSA